MFLTQARITRALIKILIVLVASLALIISLVSDAFMFWIEDFKLYLIDISRSRVVKPTVETFLMLAQFVNCHLPLYQIGCT